MAVVTKTVLKSYFNDGDVPTESNYIDLIDTMGDGDMLKSVYDIGDDGIVDNADKLDGIHASGFHKSSEAIVTAYDVRVNGGLSVGDNTMNLAGGYGWFQVSVVSGTYGVHGSMDNLVIEQSGPAGITFITNTASSAYISRIDRTESDLWRQGIRFNNNDGVDIFADNVYVLQAFADRVYIATDLRVLNGLYVGADVDPTDNDIIAVGDIKAGSGMVVGSTTATPATGVFQLYSSDSIAHTLGPDIDGVTEGVVLRTATNPATGERIFSVQSSGAGDRLIVKHGYAVEAPDGFNTIAGFAAGSNSIEAGAGDILYTGNLVSYRNSNSYSVYGANFYGTSMITGWTTANKVVGTYSIDTSARGLPVGIKAVYFRLGGTWVNANNSYWASVRRKGSSTNPNVLRGNVGNYFHEMSGWVPCDANGDFEVEVAGATLSGATLEIHGYMI